MGGNLRKVKTAVKAWHAEFQKTQKRKEEELLEKKLTNMILWPKRPTCPHLTMKSKLSEHA